MRFTVRRPPSGEVSPCGHRPSGGDVACSVHIGVAPPSIASLALENRLALAVPRCDVPTFGATLRRVRSRDLLDPAESLVLQTPYELTPATSAHRTIEPALLGDSDTRLLESAARRAGHRRYGKGLDPDYVEPPCEIGGSLLHPILTPIPLTGLQLGDRPFRLVAAIGAALGAGQPLLQHLQPSRFIRGKTGCVQQLAGRQRSRHRNSAVDADHAIVTWTCDRVGDVREDDMPATSPITGNPVGLDALGYWPRHAEPHPSDLGDPYPANVAVEPFDVMRFQPDLPKTFVHTGFAPCRAAMRAVEEVLHGLREIAQRLLLHRLTPGPKPRVLGAGFRQLRTLLHIAGSLAARLPMLLLLHRQIPHIPRISTVRQQHFLLLGSGQQSKPRHIRTVTTTTDIPGVSTHGALATGFIPRLRFRVSSRRKHP